MLRTQLARTNRRTYGRTDGWTVRFYYASKTKVYSRFMQVSLYVIVHVMLLAVVQIWCTKGATSLFFCSSKKSSCSSTKLLYPSTNFVLGTIQFVLQHEMFLLEHNLVHARARTKSCSKKIMLQYESSWSSMNQIVQEPKVCDRSHIFCVRAHISCSSTNCLCSSRKTKGRPFWYTIQYWSLLN